MLVGNLVVLYSWIVDILVVTYGVRSSRNVRNFCQIIVEFLFKCVDVLQFCFGGIFQFSELWWKRVEKQRSSNKEAVVSDSTNPPLFSVDFGFYPIFSSYVEIPCESLYLAAT